MKANKFLFSFLALGLTLTSCNKYLDDDDDNGNYADVQFPCSNLVIPKDDSAFATNALYTLRFLPLSGTVSVSSADLNLGFGANTFKTSAMKANTQYGNAEGIGNQQDMTTFSGGSYEGNGLTIKNLQGFTSSAVYFLSTNDPINPEFPFTKRFPLVISYTVNNDYTVKTFLSDAIYKGLTTIATEGSTEEPFTNDAIRYRVRFSNDYKIADVIFYEARFDAAMPRSINCILQGLEVKFTKNGYVISNPTGMSIVPSLYTESGLTPFPTYTFSKFELTNVSSDLTECSINYVVDSQGMQGNPGNQYTGTFRGSYVVKDLK